MSEFLKVNPELGMMNQSSETKIDKPEIRRKGYMRLAVALGAGALVLTGCSMPEEKTETAYFNVVCNDNSEPTIIDFRQIDIPGWKDTDTVSIGCLEGPNSDIKAITKTETADDSNIAVKYRYGDGFMQEGEPQITADTTTGKISFYGESTIESAVAKEQEKYGTF